MKRDEFENELSKINIRTEEINEILGVPPKWIIRWGITIIFVVIAIIFLGSSLFSYPDILLASATITSQNPPSVIISKANGKITDIMFSDGSYIQKGDTIAVIENPASLNDIRTLSKIIIDFNSSDKSILTNKKFSNKFNLKLGELQNQFNSFLKSYLEYQTFLKQNYRSQKIIALEIESTHYEQYYRNLLSQRNLVIKDIELAQNQYARDSLLYKDNVIPVVEAERTLSVLLAKKQLLETAQLNLTNTLLTIERIKQNITDLMFEQENQNNILKENLLSFYNAMISSLSSWEKNYLLIAPSSGILTYMNVWSNLQEVKVNERLFTINPEKRGEVFAIINIPFQGIGKIKPGEHVNIKLDGYPFMEYGIIEGYIQSVSGGYTEKGFPAIVKLINGTKTTYGIELSFERDLTGIAEITTEELTLLKRFLNPLKYIFKNRILIV